MNQSEIFFKKSNREAISFLDSCYKFKKPALMFGIPGTGKKEIIKKWAKFRKIKNIITYQMTPDTTAEDLYGKLYPNLDKESK
jgi:MoxR-like ATPase